MKEIRFFFSNKSLKQGMSLKMLRKGYARQVWNTISYIYKLKIS
jgi:hypothetical protein